MSLATRCGHCGTIFRVVQDQLKVSEGWVRCGRCGDVFNALQALFDLEREAPPPFPGRSREDDRDAVPTKHTPLTPAAPTPTQAPVTARTAWPAEAPESPKAHEAPAVPAERRPDEPVRVWRTPVDNPPTDSMPPAPAARAAFAQDEEEPRFGPAWRDEPIDDVAMSRAAAGDTRAEPGFDPTRQDDALTRVDDPLDADRFAEVQAQATEALPGFLRDEPERSPTSPLARAAWAFLGVVLALLLVGQVAVHHRDSVAQSWPWSRPLLAQWCAAAGCELLDAPRRIEAFSVETSSLTKKSATGEAYRLSVTLRNRSAQAALMPSIDLTLKDASGTLLVRRALNPAEFRVSRPVVAAGAEATLQLVMTAAKGPVSGYQIEIFYP